MLKLLKSRSALLALGSAVASALNFYSFVLFPAWFGVGGLDTFARDNYLGGLYLSGVASSVAPIGVFVLSGGSRPALLRYAGLSAIGLVAVVWGGWSLASAPWSFACLVGAICMHCAGFLLAALICEGRVGVAGALQVLQPAIFAALLTAARFDASAPARWALLYLLSTLCCVGFFAAFTRWRTLWAALQPVRELPAPWRTLVVRMVLCVSFALFFQIELILCGQFTGIVLGQYTIIQKLYSSISISIFGSLGVLMLAKQTREPGSQILNRNVLYLGLFCVMAVMLVGVLVSLTGSASSLSLPLIAASAATAFAFTVASFTSLMMQAHHAARSMQSLFFALTVYLVSFFVIRPTSALGMLTAAGGFFFTYLAVSLLLTSGQRKGRHHVPKFGA